MKGGDVRARILVGAMLLGPSILVGSALARGSRSSISGVLVGVIVLLPLLLLAIAVSGRTRGLVADIQVRNGQFEVRPRGAFRLWACRRRVSVPLSCIRAVTVTSREQIPIGRRLIGTSVQGVLTAGVFGVGSERSFWLVRKGAVVLLVDLHDASYRRIVVELAEAKAVADRLRLCVAHEWEVRGD